MTQPFRWNISKREQLGQLVHGPPAESYPQFISDLQLCCSRVIAFCDDSDLIFVGRSPESIFDYLSGLLINTSWNNRICMLNISIRGPFVSKIKNDYPDALTAIYEQLSDLQLAPPQIIKRSRSIAFVDLVASGSTLGNLTELILKWADECNADKNAVKQKIRFVGITWEKKTSPNTLRWQQQAEWAKQFRSRQIKNISIPWRLWGYLGNEQKKVALSNSPRRWGKQELQNPPHYENNLQALRLALYLYDLGTSRVHQLDFAKTLSMHSSMKHQWFRSLVTELRYLG